MHVSASQHATSMTCEELWTIAIDIYRSIQGEIHNVEGKIAFSTLHEHFAQLEPNFYISRARFLFCVRRTVSTEKVFQGVNSRISLFLRKMDDFFQKCDVFEQDKMNWRVFILMTYALENPKLTFKEVAEQALCLLYSDGSSVVSIMECTGQLKMSVFRDTIDPFINAEMKVTFLDRLYYALVEVSFYDKDPDANSWKGGLGAMVPFQLFTRLQYLTTSCRPISSTSHEDGVKKGR